MNKTHAVAQQGGHDSRLSGRRGVPVRFQSWTNGTRVVRAALLGKRRVEASDTRVIGRFDEILYGLSDSRVAGWDQGGARILRHM